ncbi:hypothetical protein X777_09182 [Ooceraea biroi]|uniref:Uncharacterized protein n=1 Tax=Ooceraea biroi TaxID=2015173 RepID=A0A026WA26_OOCBI|nr:hypothetical protein X777_09182 [Ooceraea biroi]
MSGFAIRMSAYKTVNKRADLKRNFAASLACSGYTGSRKGAQRGEGNRNGFWRNRRARSGDVEEGRVERIGK